MTREEAIKKVRWGLLGLAIDKDVRDAFETLIPELRESEDERIRKMCITAVNIAASAGGGLLHHEATQCLDWFEKQKEQKPVVTHGETYRVDTLGTQQVIAGKMPQKLAEWSEADEEMLKMILGDLEWERRNTVVGKDIKLYDEKIAWLKSLRPVSKESLQSHWKPSEEQMKALEEYGKCKRCIKELYEQLKKLM